MKRNLHQIDLIKKAAANCFAAYRAFLLTFHKSDEIEIDFSNICVETALKDVCSKLKFFIVVVTLFNNAPKASKEGLPKNYIEFIESDLVSKYPSVYLHILEQRDVSFLDFKMQIILFEIVLRITNATITNITLETLLEPQDNDESLSFEF